jgi:uncharacterized protein DUF6941
MLLVPHGAFYKDVAIVDGAVRPSDEFRTLHFFDFPAPAQTLHLVLSFYITAEVTGMLSHRLRRWTDEIYQSRAVEVHFPQPADSKQFDYVYDLLDVVFPRPGVYVVDVLLDGAVLYSVSLSIVQIK